MPIVKKTPRGGSTMEAIILSNFIINKYQTLLPNPYKFKGKSHLAKEICHKNRFLFTLTEYDLFHLGHE